MSKCHNNAACYITYSNARGTISLPYYAATGKEAMCNAIADIIVKQRLIYEYIPLSSVLMFLLNIDE